jgi:hypothetical protein
MTYSSAHRLDHLCVAGDEHGMISDRGVCVRDGWDGEMGLVLTKVDVAFRGSFVMGGWGWCATSG